MRNFWLPRGAEPTIPRVENLGHVPFLKLRTMADALHHLDVIPRARSAIVMGTGLVGMHAAENFVHRGMHVDVIRARARKNPRIMPNYFDEEFSGMIQKVFESHDVNFYLTDHAVRVAYEGGEFIATLSSGKALRAEMLLVCTGIKPRTEFLSHSSVKVDEGILVDHKMRTSVDHTLGSRGRGSGRRFLRPLKNPQRHPPRCGASRQDRRSGYVRRKARFRLCRWDFNEYVQFFRKPRFFYRGQ